MSAKIGQWMALESNPEAMTKFVRSIGVPEPHCVVDVFGFDPDLQAMIPKPVHAVLLVFPEGDGIRSTRKAEYESLGKDKVPEDVFHMPQLISNACGTFALIHALANSDGIKLPDDGVFLDFLKAAKSVEPSKRSEVLLNHTAMATAHTECAQSGDTSEPEKVVHHFICFVPRGGRLLEIGKMLGVDSAMPHALDRGVTSSDTFLTDVGKQMHKMVEASGGKVEFSAMALVGSAPAF